MDGVAREEVGFVLFTWETSMKRLVIGLVLLLVVPMVLLNPLGREAFLGYYAGILAMWLTFVSVGTWQQRNRKSARTH
jgi:hypothetical protein